MAFPSIAATATTNGSTAAANKTCNLPSGVQAGDLLLLWLRSAGSDTHTTPSGWQSLVLNNGADASDDVTSLFYRVADGTEGSTVVVTATTSRKFAALAWRITGADTATAPAVAVAVGTSNAPNPPSLSPSWGTADCLWLAVYGIEGTSTVSAWPANYTLSRITIATSGGSAATNTRVAGAGRELTAATEDPAAFTASASEDWTAATVAIRGLDLTPVSDSESGLGSVSDAESTAAQTAASDTVTPSAAESEESYADSSDNDGLFAAVADAEQVAADAASSDTLSPALGESNAVETVTEVDSSDDLAAAVADAATVNAAAADADTSSDTVDAHALAAAEASSDTLTAAAAESEAIVALAADSDALSTWAAEAETVAAASASTDDLSVNAVDSGSLAAAAAEADTGASIVESEQVEQAGYVVTDSDTAAAAFAESASISSSITANDALAAAADEALVAVEAGAADTVSAQVTDGEAMAAALSTDDDAETMLPVLEALAAVIQAVDPLSAAIGEAIGVGADRGPWVAPRNRFAAAVPTQAKAAANVKFTVEGVNVFRPKRS